jgi:hypothetical protein
VSELQSSLLRNVPIFSNLSLQILYLEPLLSNLSNLSFAYGPTLKYDVSPRPLAPLVGFLRAFHIPIFTLFSYFLSALPLDSYPPF